MPQSGWQQNDGQKKDISKYVQCLLIKKAHILKQYFNIQINCQNGNILSLPYVIQNYIPPLSCLPMFILRLATEINWDIHIDFHHISMEIARFYQIRYSRHYMPIRNNYRQSIHIKWMVQHSLFYSFQNKRKFHPPKFLSHDGTIVQIACLNQLYKVFERC